MVQAVKYLCSLLFLKHYFSSGTQFDIAEKWVGPTPLQVCLPAVPLSVSAQNLLSTVQYSCWIAWTLLQLGRVCVVPVRDYFLYNEAVTTKCTKVNKAFPSLRCMPPVSPRITCVRLCCRRASSNHSHHCTLPSLSATQLILTACLRPSHSMSSIT